jgi:hypothetical protein
MAVVPVGCSGTTADGVDWRAAGTLPCPRLDAKTKTHDAVDPPDLSLEPVGRAAFSGSVGFADLWGRYVSFTPNAEGVVVCDLHTGRVTTVARKANGSSVLYDYTAGSRQTVVFSSLSRVPDPNRENGSVDWTISSMDVRTGARRDLAKSTEPTGVDRLPLPQVDWPWVVWLQSHASSSSGGQPADLHVVDLRDAHHDVRPLGAGATSVGITNGMVVYDTPGTPAAAGDRDLFMVPAEGGRPETRLTNVGDVGNFIVANGGVVFSRHRGPAGLWMMPVDGSQPAVDLGAGRHGVPGRGFALMNRIDGLFVQRAADRRSLLLVGPDGVDGQFVDNETKYDVDGDIVLWATRAESGAPGSRLLRLDRVLDRRPGP